MVNQKHPSVARGAPKLAAEWHPTKNGELTPGDVSLGSSRKVWWRCARDAEHEWRTVVYQRGRNGSGCPYCAGKRPTSDTSLAAVHPEVAALWHPRKNGSLTPSEVTPHSGRKIWWRCPNGKRHTFQRSPAQQVDKGGCAACSGRTVTWDTSLAGRAPTVAALWDPDNDPPGPEAVRPTSQRVVTWRCPDVEHHRWEREIRGAVRRKGKCPVCEALARSLAVRQPEVAAYWHPERNGSLLPVDVMPGSHDTVWWLCPNSSEHEWQQPVNKRMRGVRDGIECPFCSGRSLAPGETLAALRPELAAQWHPKKNRHRPEDVGLTSALELWWQCPERQTHVWSARVVHRVNGSGCPYCSGHRADATTCLSATHPELARQWHPDRNGDTTPRDVKAGTHAAAWWQCPARDTHVWRASVKNRALHGRGCPYCANRIATDETSLRALHPEFARQWHPERNGTLTPDDVTPGSPRKVWWRCAHNPHHIWPAVIHSRARRGTGCPFCAGHYNRKKKRRKTKVRVPKLI